MKVIYITFLPALKPLTQTYTLCFCLICQPDSQEPVEEPKSLEDGGTTSSRKEPGSPNDYVDQSLCSNLQLTVILARNTLVLSYSS